MELRYYQRDCIAAIYDYFRRSEGNPIGALPTATGKSYIIAEFLRGVFRQWPAERAMMVTHVKELIDQNYKELIELWPTAPAGIYSAGLGKKEVRPITFAGIMSVVNKGSLFGFVNFLLIDECHLVGPDDEAAYKAFITELKVFNPKLKVIGLTATPYRLGQGLLTEPVWKNGKLISPLFTDICYDITGMDSFNRLIKEGYLCPLFPRPTNAKLDVTGVKIIGGEFAQGQLQDAVDRDELTYACIQESIRLGHDRKHWLVFATGVRHCEHVASMLDSCGISAVTVHSKTSKEDRRKNVEQFKAGQVRALVNNVVFIAGFNFKPIDLIVDLQPTSSASRHVQKYGRGTRIWDFRIAAQSNNPRERELARTSPFVKTDCLVLDFAGNTNRNGPINDPVIPKRSGQRGGGGGGGAPVKVCPHCMTYNHASVRFCEKCQEEFPLTPVALNSTASTADVIAGGEPKFEVFKVEGVEYRRHGPFPNSTKPACLKVDYQCGLRTFSDWVCLEHIGFASKRARDWWRNAADDHISEPPSTIREALCCLEVLQRPTHIRVWVNCVDPKVVAYDYSGTAFGTEKPTT